MAAATNKGSNGINVLPLTVFALYISSCIPITDTIEDSLITTINSLPKAGSMF